MNQYTNFSDVSYFQQGNDVEIWYMRREFFREFIAGETNSFDPKNPEKTHILLGSIGYPNNTDKDEFLELTFSFLQGENWSRNGEANTLIKSKGLAHTSMSIGDIVRFRKTNEYYIVSMVGFKRIRVLATDKEFLMKQDILH